MGEFGRYEVLKEIGRGMFGRVYLAIDPPVRRQVAIKVLAASADADAYNRFQIEADTIAKLNHKNIVRVLDFATESGCSYLVMEFVEGRTLQNIIEGADSLPLLQKVEIMYQVAEGLQHAHDRGVIHRDIKPSNIMMDSEGNIKIMDFGTAAIVGADGTRTCGLRGTISYMSPELINSGEVGRKADIFAFGVVYYELLTGINPFRAADDGTSMYLISRHEPEPLRSLAPDSPPALEVLISSLLVKEPEMRCNSLQDVLFDSDPIIRELRSHCAEESFSGVSALIQANDFAAAREAINRVLEICPDHERARALRGELQQREQQRLLAERLRMFKEEGKRLTSGGQYQRAIEILENALRLSAADEETRGLLNEAKSGLDRARKVVRLLSEARWEQSAGDLDVALQKAREAGTISPEDRKVTALLADLEAEAQIRARKVALNRAAELLARNEFEAARSQLDFITANAAYASDADLLRQEIDETEWRIQARGERERAIAISVRNSIAASQFSVAQSDLRAGLEELPGSEELANLEADLEAAIGAYDQASSAARLVAEIRLLLASGRLSEAIAQMNAALVSCGALDVLVTVKQEVAAALQDAENQVKRKAEDQRENEALARANAAELEDGIAILEDSLSDSPERPKLLEALNVLVQRRAEKVERKRQREEMLKKLESLVLSELEKGDFSAAERRLAETRSTLGDEDVWRRLDRHYRQRQRYETGLLMAEKANLSGDNSQAREILTFLLAAASDNRAETMLNSLRERAETLPSPDAGQPPMNVSGRNKRSLFTIWRK